MFEALKDGDEKVLRHFLDEKDLIFARNDKGQTLLIEAVVREKESICLYLICKAPSLISETDRVRRVPRRRISTHLGNIFLTWAGRLSLGGIPGFLNSVANH